MALVRENGTNSDIVRSKGSGRCYRLFMDNPSPHMCFEVGVTNKPVSLIAQCPGHDFPWMGMAGLCRENCMGNFMEENLFHIFPGCVSDEISTEADFLGCESAHAGTFLGRVEGECPTFLNQGLFIHKGKCESLYFLLIHSPAFRVFGIPSIVSEVNPSKAESLRNKCS
jgi:hypothetical protein